MRAYILITTERDKADEVQAQLRAVEMDQLRLLYVDLIAGTYDVIVVVDADDPKVVGA